MFIREAVFYAVLAVILGRLTVLHGEGILPVFGLAICAVFLLLTALLRREQPLEQIEEPLG